MSKKTAAIKNMEYAVKLYCDICESTLIGYVNALDLEGSYFYCLECIKKEGLLKGRRRLEKL